MAGASQGAVSQLALNAQAMEFLRVVDESDYGLVDNGDRAIRGILDHIKERVAPGLRRFRFAVEMEPSPEELDVLLPLIGFDEDTPGDNGFKPQETIPSFTAIIDRVAKVHTYATCKVDKATFRGQKGNRPIALRLDIIGTSMTEGAAGSFSATAITSGVVYTLCQGVLTLGGSAELFDRFALVIDNHLAVEFNNSCAANSITATQRTIHLAASHPYTSDETALFTTPGPGSTPHDTSGLASSSLVFTNGSESTTFTFGNLKALATPPHIPGKQEIRLEQTYKAYKSGSTDALVITHVNA